MANNVKVTVADGVFAGLKTESEVQSLQDFLTEMKGVSNSMDENSTPEDFLRALDQIGVVEVLELEDEIDGRVTLAVKKTIN